MSIRALLEIKGRETYRGRRSSAQVGLLAKAFRNGDQFVISTLEYLDSMWSDYKGGCAYRQHIWLSSWNFKGKEEKLTIDLMVQRQHQAGMIFYEFVICSIALNRRSPNRISWIKAPVDQLLILFAETWQTLLLYSPYSRQVKAIWTLMRRQIAFSVLTILELTCSEVKVLRFLWAQVWEPIWWPRL